MFHSRPVRSLRQLELLASDHRPGSPHFRVDREELGLICGQIGFGADGIYRALRDAKSAVDAIVRIDREEVHSFAKRVNRAHADAGGELAVDASLSDDVSHCGGRTADRERPHERISTAVSAPKRRRQEQPPKPRSGRGLLCSGRRHVNAKQGERCP